MLIPSWATRAPPLRNSTDGRVLLAGSLVAIGVTVEIVPATAEVTDISNHRYPTHCACAADTAQPTVLDREWLILFRPDPEQHLILHSARRASREPVEYEVGRVVMR